MPSDDADPPRKFYGFKAPQFERINPVPDGPAESPPAADAGVSTDAGGRIDVHDLARIAAASAAPLGTNTVKNRGNEVHDLLRLNAVREDAAGLNVVALPPKRRSRRKRDYWLVAGCGNAVLVTLAAIAGPKDPIVFVYAIGGLGAFNASLAWVMWMILDDY